MRRFESPMLGIDLTDREIRVVRVGGKSGSPKVIQASSAPLAPGIIEEGVILDPASASFALSRLLESMKLSHATHAVVAIPPHLTSARFISVPVCPDHELPALVEGEMEHQGFPRTDSFSYDYFAFSRGDKSTDPMCTVAVLSAESGSTEALAEVMKGAGLKIVAIEPAHLALLRMASLGVAPGSSTFFLVIGKSITAAAYFVGERLVSIRRFELGSGPLLRQAAYERAAEEGGAPVRIDHAAIDRLAVETLQTMEYVQREVTEEIASVCIVSDEPELEPLAGMLGRRLGIETAFLNLPAGLPGLNFGTAFGLAIRSTPLRFEVPKMDMFSNRREQLTAAATKRNFRGAVVLAGFALSLGLAGFLLYNLQIARFSNVSRSLASDVADLQNQTKKILADRESEKQKYEMLRKEGVPLGAIMDGIVGSLDSGVRLKTVTINPDRKLLIEGEAHDEAAVIRIAQRLQGNPMLADVELGQFARAANTGSDLTFQIAGTTVSGDRIKEGGKRF